MSARPFRRPDDSALTMLATAASLLISAFAVWMILRDDHPVAILVWLAAAAIAHDLIAFPLYSVFDRIAFGALESDARNRPIPTPAINFVRIPVFLSALMALVWLPLVAGISTGYLESISGIETDFLGRWLALSGAMFVISGLAYALRLRRSRSEA